MTDDSEHHHKTGLASTRLEEGTNTAMKMTTDVTVTLMNTKGKLLLQPVASLTVFRCRSSARKREQATRMRRSSRDTTSQRQRVSTWLV